MYNYCYPYMPYMNIYDNEDLEEMYPRIYHRIYPMIKMHCDKMERTYGWMYSPTEKDMADVCDDIYENIKDYLHELDDDDNNNHHTRQRPYGRRGDIDDLIRILFLREISGRRRRRRRHMRPHYGYWY